MSLFSYLTYLSNTGSSFNENDITNILVSISSGLDCLMSNKIIHRDIKSHNVLVDIYDNKYINSCICDFGSSIIVSPTCPLKEPAGTARWMSPEIHKQEVYDYSTDVWSFGMTLLEILSLKLPYHDVMVLDISSVIMQEKLPKVDFVLESYSKFHPLLFNCLQFDPRKRPNPKNIIEISKLIAL